MTFQFVGGPWDGEYLDVPNELHTVEVAFDPDILPADWNDPDKIGTIPYWVAIYRRFAGAFILTQVYKVTNE